MMMEINKQLERLGKAFLINEIASGFPVLGLMKNPEIQMRIDWVNRLKESKKSLFIEELFERRETSPMVIEFESLLIRPSGGSYLFATRKDLFKKLKKDEALWKFSTVDGETIAANYEIKNVELRVSVYATNKHKNINIWHTIYQKNKGIVGYCLLTWCSRFYHQDAWHAENLDADQEYDSVIKILNSGYDMLSEAIHSCEDPFRNVK